MPIAAAALIGGGSALSAGSSLIGAGKGASAATQAAQMQTQAARLAAQLQYGMFQQYQGNLAPWMGAGQQALGQLQGATGTNVGGVPAQAQLTAPLNTSFQSNNLPYSIAKGTNPLGGGNVGGTFFQPGNMGLGGYNFTPQGVGLSFAPQGGIGMTFAPTMDQLSQTPGYQWQLQQGLQAVVNQNASLGLAGSGAEGKGLVNYAEGLAGTTYQNQFNNWLQTLNTQYNLWQGQLGEQYNIYNQNLAQQYGIFSGQLGQQYGIWQGQNALGLQQNQQIYNMLGGIAGTGQNAAVNTGTAGLSAAGQAGNALTSAAAAGASGIIGSTNALNAGLGGAVNAVSGGLNNYLMFNMLQNMNGGQGLFGGGGSSNLTSPGMNNLTALTLGNYAVGGPTYNALTPQ